METFTITKTGGSKTKQIKAQDSVAFRTAHKLWIYAQAGGNSQLRANAPKPDKNAQFKMYVVLLQRTASKPIRKGKYAGDRAQIRNASGLCLVPSKNSVRVGKMRGVFSRMGSSANVRTAYQLYYKGKCLVPKPGVLADSRIPLVLAAKCTQVFTRSSGKTGWIRYTNHCLRVRDAKKGTVDVGPAGRIRPRTGISGPAMPIRAGSCCILQTTNSA